MRLNALRASLIACVKVASGIFTLLSTFQGDMRSCASAIPERRLPGKKLVGAASAESRPIKDNARIRRNPFFLIKNVSSLCVQSYSYDAHIKENYTDD